MGNLGVQVVEDLQEHRGRPLPRPDRDQGRGQGVVEVDPFAGVTADHDGYYGRQARDHTELGGEQNGRGVRFVLGATTGCEGDQGLRVVVHDGHGVVVRQGIRMIS